MRETYYYSEESELQEDKLPLVGLLQPRREDEGLCTICF